VAVSIAVVIIAVVIIAVVIIAVVSLSAVSIVVVSIAEPHHVISNCAALVRHVMRLQSGMSCGSSPHSGSQHCSSQHCGSGSHHCGSNHCGATSCHAAPVLVRVETKILFCIYAKISLQIFITFLQKAYENCLFSQKFS
jgi:hypothetical protein